MKKSTNIWFLYIINFENIKKDRDIEERSRTLLKNKEIRTFKSEVLKQYDTINEIELNTIIPNKASITLIKLHNKTLMYAVDSLILFFQSDNDKKLYPTLSFLWHFPNILKTFVIYRPVSEYVLKGFDLMLPGSLSSINDLKDSKILPVLK